MILGKTKKKMWHHFYKIFMKVQRVLLRYGILHYKDRQQYHIGWLAPEKSLDELKTHLHNEWGFGNHFISWIDPGQVLSWRKLSDTKNQYHLRVFYDGEIRGHFEATPEASILNHMFKKGIKESQLDFLKFLGDFVVYNEYISDLKVDPNAYNPNAEIVKE